MTERHLSVGARVRVEIEVTQTSSWGQDCTMKQIVDQASREALNAIQRMMDGSVERVRIRIIGKPVVTAVVASDEGV